MKVINLIGGPCVGKSVMASKIFADLKVNGYNTEIIFEYAKDLVYEDRKMVLDDQLYILAKTNKKLKILEKNNIDFVVLDGSLLLIQYYAQINDYKVGGNSFDSLIRDIYNSYDNMLLYIKKPDFEYQEHGRLQTSEQATLIGSNLISFLNKEKLDYKIVDNNLNIMEII